MNRRQPQFEDDKDMEREIRRHLWNGFKVMILFILGWLAVGWISYEAFTNNWK